MKRPSKFVFSALTIGAGVIVYFCLFAICRNVNEHFKKEFEEKWLEKLRIEEEEKIKEQ